MDFLILFSTFSRIPKIFHPLSTNSFHSVCSRNVKNGILIHMLLFVIPPESVNKALE